MGRFLDTELDVTYISFRRWRLAEDLLYVTNQADTIAVPAGFETDFASIPRVLWSIAPPMGQWGLAAVVHDFCYRTGLLERKEADRVFLEAMADLGVRWITRWAMYLAVRAAGWTAYRSPAQSAARS